MSSSESISSPLKVSTIFFGTLGAFTLIFLFVGFPIILIATGYKYFHDCPAEPKLPKFLIGGGVIVCLQLLNHIKRALQGREEDIPTLKEVTVGYCFFFWFVAGCVLLCSLSLPDFTNVRAQNYCQKKVYATSVLSVVLVWAVLTGSIAMNLYNTVFRDMDSSSVEDDQD